MDIHTNIIYSRTGYDVVIYFWSKVMAEKLLKIPGPVASCGISRERFKQGSRTFPCLLRTIGLTNLPDMTSLAGSGRLQNAIKYCIKVRKTGPTGKEWNISTIL